jgi:hypothetical protein
VSESDREGEGGTVRAVVDRIVEGVAVLLVGDEETQFDVPVDELPSQVRQGSWLRVRLRGADVEVVDLDPEATERARESAEAQRDRLRRRSRRFGG